MKWSGIPIYKNFPQFVMTHPVKGFSVITEAVKVKSLSHVQLFGTPWAVDCQAPPSMDFSQQEYWSSLPFPSPGDSPYPGIESMSPASPALRVEFL